MKLNLPVILLKGTILMPEEELKLEFSDEVSKSIIDEAELFHGNKILIITKTSLDENLIIQELPLFGTLSFISKKLELPNGNVRITLKGKTRAQVLEYLNPNKDVLESIIYVYPKNKISDEIKNGIVRKLFFELNRCIKNIPYMSDSLISLLENKNELDEITDIIVSHIPIESKRKLEYLSEINSIKRAEMILEDLYREEQLSNIERNIDTKVKKELDDDQKNFYIKEKIKLLREELGESSLIEENLKSLKNKAESLNINESLKNKILYEIDRYENMPSISPEVPILKNYIDFFLDLPWNIYTKDIDDLNLVKESLEKTHYGMKDVKERIIEYLAIKKHSKNINAPILCLVGPSGVGKTTFARQIAESLGRKFVKISLGGVDDASVIKGHIRTYLGAKEGAILDGIRRAKSSNPVFLIDEIDKMACNIKGDPESALLDVLDFNQNKEFKDNYLEENYDLSQVLFITTANDVSKLSNAFLNRLEIININGYTEFEKLKIAKDYLIPSLCSKHGVNNIKINDDEIIKIIKFYTKESGVRQLEAMLSKIIRKIVTNKYINNKRINLNVTDVSTYLGKMIYTPISIKESIGLVNVLACTQYGGDVIKLEVNSYKGNEDIILTGSMGDTLKESVEVALGYIKSNYEIFGIDYEQFKNTIHINMPNISCKKDGPSAGVAITTAIISALSNFKVSNKIAFTGEITLRGNILKIGGFKEKVIGAYLNDIDLIFMPKGNIDDLDDITDDIKSKIKFVPIEDYMEIFNYLKKN